MLYSEPALSSQWLIHAPSMHMLSTPTHGTLCSDEDTLTMRCWGSRWALSCLHLAHKFYSGDWTQVPRLCGEHLLSHLSTFSKSHFKFSFLFSLFYKSCSLFSTHPASFASTIGNREQRAGKRTEKMHCKQRPCFVLSMNDLGTTSSNSESADISCRE